LDLKNITAGIKRGNIFGSPDVGLYQVKPAFECDPNFAPGSGRTKRNSLT